jgi:hypothetical protein
VHPGVENCQVGVYLGDVSAVEHVLVNMRLFLPRESAKDNVRQKKCPLPREVYVARSKVRHLLVAALARAWARSHFWPCGV